MGPAVLSVLLSVALTGVTRPRERDPPVGQDSFIPSRITVLQEEDTYGCSSEAYAVAETPRPFA